MWATADVAAGGVVLFQKPTGKSVTRFLRPALGWIRRQVNGIIATIVSRPAGIAK